MEIIIKIGKNPDFKTVDYLNHHYLDNYSDECRMMELVLKEKDITIRNATEFLTYYANNLVARNIVMKNPDLPKDLAKRFNIKPENIKIIEVSDNGEEVCIQNARGLLKKNYFNELMDTVMDDYYESLNYYEPEEWKKENK